MASLRILRVGSTVPCALPRITAECCMRESSADDMEFQKTALELLDCGWRASGTGGLIQHASQPARRVVLDVAVAMRRVQEERYQPPSFFSGSSGTSDDAFWAEMDSISPAEREISRKKWEELMADVAARHRVEDEAEKAIIRKDWDAEFAGKVRPGDWRPVGTEACPICTGNGVAVAGRLCSRCRGRGYVKGGKQQTSPR